MVLHVWMTSSMPASQSLLILLLLIQTKLPFLYSIAFPSFLFTFLLFVFFVEEWQFQYHSYYSIISIFYFYYHSSYIDTFIVLVTYKSSFLWWALDLSNMSLVTAVTLFFVILQYYSTFFLSFWIFSTNSFILLTFPDSSGPSLWIFGWC